MKTSSTIFTQVAYGFSITLLLLVVSQSALSSTIINGGFETGDLTGWSSSGNIGVFSSGIDNCCVPSEGQYAATFNSGDTAPNGQLSQTFTTIQDVEYILNFDFAKGGSGSGISSLNIKVEGVNTLLDEAVSDSTGGEPGLYSSFLFSFIADSTSSTLTFTDISTGTVSFDALLDNVSVSNVPIPAAAWLFGSGLLAMLGFRRS